MFTALFDGFRTACRVSAITCLSSHHHGEAVSMAADFGPDRISHGFEMANTGLRASSGMADPFCLHYCVGAIVGKKRAAILQFAGVSAGPLGAPYEIRR